MGIVNQTVQDAIGDSGIPDLLVPARDRQLGSKDGGASLVAVLTGRTWAQGGAGYWLDRECMAAVGSSPFLPPAHNMEDCMVGSTLALLGIYPEHDERYQTGYTGQSAASPV